MTDLLKQIFTVFQSTLTADQPLILAVSGGPDSMLVSYSIHQYYISQSRNTDHLHILHCNHNQREKSDQEYLIIKKAFPDSKIKIATYPGQKATENELRKRRKQELIKYAQEKKATYILTGHNLTDRIETTLMNMLRGCHLTGLINMQTVHHDPMHGHIWYKPLLELPKPEIQKGCDDLHIPYVIDPTNIDPKTSKRNLIRHQFLFPLAEKANNTKAFRESRNILYQMLENAKGTISLTISSPNSNTREVLKEGERTNDHTVSLLQHLGIYNDLSNNLITQISHVCCTPGKQIFVHGWTIRSKREKLLCEKN